MAAIKALNLLTAAALISQSSAQITNDTYFYGQSEPVYPSPEIDASGPWADAISKAKAFVAQLTIEEKTNLTGGYANTENGCSGNIYPIERLGFPGYCVTDAGNGVRATDFVNGYASGISVGASWNKNLTHERGVYMGGEFLAKGVNVQLGPVVGPLGRIAEGGRNWEGYSNDPYLGGTLVAEYIVGAQSIGAGTCTKHFIGNEQETDRNPTINSNNQSVASVSSNIDDTTMHELYLWPFADAVHAGTVSIMCSYNRLNNSYGCQNSKSLNGLLKTELGFEGFVMSDWFAQHSGVASANAGLDMVMPSGLAFWGPNLTEAVNNGSVDASRLDDMATRIIAPWYHLNQDSTIPEPGFGMPVSPLAPHKIVDARNPASRSHLVQAAVEGHVLVKNENKALPLQTPKMLSLFGYDALAPRENSPSNSPGFSGWSLGLQSTDVNAVVCGFSSAYTDCPVWQPIEPNGTMITGGGSGATTPAYISAPYDAINQRAQQDGTFLFYDFINAGSNATVSPETDACLVFMNAAASEGIDRNGIRDDFSDGIVHSVASQCNNTIVVIHNAGVRLVDQWIENPNVTAVIFAHLPGQDSGHALVQLLYGEVSPSGKLPYTVPRNESDYGNLFAPVRTPEGDQYSLYPQDNFSEGIYIDYRAFDAQNITPRYEFGFGLTYTTFSYADISASVVNSGGNLTEYPTGSIIPGGAADLWDTIATVTATVQNTGDVAAAEVAQLYIGVPASGQPIRQLRGFEKVYLQPGEQMTVEFELRRRDLSVWDVVAQQWKLVLGSAYTVSVGASSRDLPLVTSITL